MTINHYEIKEIREINNEAARDKNDFQAFRQQHNQGANWSGLANHEDIQYYLKLLLESFPGLMRPQKQMMYANNQGGAGQVQRHVKGGMQQNNKRNYGNPNMRQQYQNMGGPNNMVNAGMMQGQMGAMNNMNN